MELNFYEFDWHSIFSVVDSTKNMTSNQMLGLRTQLLELAISKYSNAQLTYVGNECNGCDFIGVDGLRYECKSMKGLFQRRSKYTKSLVLKNYYGDSIGYEQRFDRMIMIDTTNFTVGVVNYQDVLNNLDYKRSTINARINTDCVSFIVSAVLLIEKRVNFLDYLFGGLYDWI